MPTPTEEPSQIDEFMIDTAGASLRSHLGEVKEKNALSVKYPFLDPEINFVDSILEVYCDILAGKMNFINIMFPSGKFHHIEYIYKNNYDSIFHNKIMANVFKNILGEFNSSSELNILEIGAGIGSSTEYLLPLLQNQKNKYFRKSQNYIENTGYKIILFLT